MTIVYDSSISAITDLVNTVTADITLAASGNDRLLVVHCHANISTSNSNAPTAVTVDGTSILTNLIASDTGNIYRRTYSYYALESDLPASSGTYTISTTWSGNTSEKWGIGITADYFTGIDQVTGLDVTGTATSNGNDTSGTVLSGSTALTDYVAVVGRTASQAAVVTFTAPTGVVKSNNVTNVRAVMSSAYDFGTATGTVSVTWTSDVSSRHTETIGLFKAAAGGASDIVLFRRRIEGL